jgi:F-type H+-transporting ATPase subunit a
MTTKPKYRFGFKRWILFGLMLLGAYLAWGVKGIFSPVPPGVTLPAESFVPGSFFTNTMASLTLAVIFLFCLAFFVVRPFVRSGQDVPSGFYQAIEMIVEMFWEAAQGMSTKWAKRIFPFTMTIFLLVLSVNLVKLIPIHETIGYLEPGRGNSTGYGTVALFNIGSIPVRTIDGAVVIKPADRTLATTTENEVQEACEEDCVLVPFFRGTATDLNFTVVLALVTMIMVQVFGFWSLGFKYIFKFVNLTTIISKPIFGLMDFIVGFLELISEFAKVLSFSLRLFGVIFAGSLLFFILGSMVPFFVPGLLYGFETFVGLIQAYVFSTLALTFMSQATVSHIGEEHAESH